jgi:hypothetical protein
MTLYTVLEPPDGNPDKVKFVAEGFSRAGFLLTFLWALWLRMWFVAALLFLTVTMISVASVAEVIDPTTAVVMQLGIMMIVGFEGRMFQVMSLERSGYRVSGLVEATRLEVAETAYFAHRKPRPPKPVSGSYRGQPHDMLGMFGNV